MPKEVVYGEKLAFEENDPRKPVVEVRWYREGTVQLVSKCIHAADGSEIQPAGTSSNSTVLVENGFYVDLDRAGINQLIRNLRRARDQALGRDE